MIPSIVYLLCALTSTLCVVLLIGNYKYAKTRLLFWSCGFFLSMAISNVLLFVDLVVLPQLDLSVGRTIITLIGICMLLFGLIWEGE